MNEIFKQEVEIDLVENIKALQQFVSSKEVQSILDDINENENKIEAKFQEILALLNDKDISELYRNVEKATF